MNGIHYGGSLGKVAQPSDLDKESRQSDTLNDAVASALQPLRQAIVEAPSDASAQQLIDAFRRALAQYDAGINEDPQTAAARFAETIDRIIREHAFGQAMKSCLRKGHDFWHR
jgi:hypothetical protein